MGEQAGHGRSQSTQDAIAAASAANVGASTASLAVEGVVSVAVYGEPTAESLEALKIAKGIAKGSAVVGGILALDQINSGQTSMDEAHGWVNLTASFAGLGCAATGVCGGLVVAGLAVYGVADTAVQFKEYQDPVTGQRFTGWEALYRDAKD